MVAITHELDKVVKFYDLDEFVQQEKDTIEIQPIYVYKNWKKITSILDINFKIQGVTMNGLIVGDKVGEIFFLNIENLDKLPKEETESQVAKLLYGH
jgi:hypothetical protein